MTNRHLSRSIAMQTLFEWDFNHPNRDKVPAILGRNIKEFASGMDDGSFSRRLIDGVLDKLSILDEIIGKAAPEWPLEKIAPIDRNILRIGLFELLFMDRKEVPAKVAINEAIELAKTFGGESSGRFVNGVMGTVYKELGEPGKEETGKKKNRAGHNNVKDFKKEELAKMTAEELAGGVVYTVEHNKVYVAFVHDIFGFWTLSKGRVSGNEKTDAAVVRELKEELGIDTVTEEKLGVNEYVASDPERGRVRKKVTYYLLRAPSRLNLEHNSDGLDDAQWFSLDEAVELHIYNDLTEIMTKAIEILSKKK